jgi:tripeptidyl-peptidase-1
MDWTFLHLVIIELSVPLTRPQLQWIQFDAPVEDAEDLLFTDFYVWEAGSDGTKDIACEQYHVPADIQHHIDYVTPGIRLRTSTSTNNDNKKTKRNTSSVPPRSNAGAEAKSPNSGIWDGAMVNVSSDYPGTNSTSCDSYIVAECIRGKRERAFFICKKRGGLMLIKLKTI